MILVMGGILEQTLTRPARQLPAVPTPESARHEVDQRPAPARPAARATHAHSPAAPLHHRAPGSREGGQCRRSTNIRGVRSGSSQDARYGPPANIRLVPVPSDRMPARASAPPERVTQSLPFILTCVALRKCVPIGTVEGAMSPPAA